VVSGEWGVGRDSYSPPLEGCPVGAGWLGATPPSKPPRQAAPDTPPMEGNGPTPRVGSTAVLGGNRPVVFSQNFYKLKVIIVNTG
jgi:hypothetical protein